MQNSHLTILLGAGASAPSGLPNWDQFARRVATLSSLVSSDAAAEILLSRQDPTIVLEAARARAGTKWDQVLHTALYGGVEGAPRPSPLHLASAGHLLAMPATTTLCTLNFDTLLEEAVIGVGEPVVVIGLDGDSETDVPTVHHLHGALFNEASYDAIACFRDYAELIAQPDAWQRRFLSDALARGPLLLAGTSYRDPDIRHWLHVILRDEKPAHPALVTISREGLGLDRQSFAEVSEALAAEWEAIGLTAVKTHDLTDVALVIRELRHLGEVGYQSPRDRARTVWNAHGKQFSSLQSRYADALASDASTVSRALGTKAHRGTLWLADGNGRLARWASEGTHFQSRSTLKHVPTGHDSPWIAGEAIGSEEVKLKDIERDSRLSPTWRSVLAIPIFASNGRSPNFATAVLTFGLSASAATLVDRQSEWWSVTEELSERWGNHISSIAFPPTPA